MGFLVSDTVLYSDWLDIDLELLYLYMEVWKYNHSYIHDMKRVVIACARQKDATWSGWGQDIYDYFLYTSCVSIGFLSTVGTD